MATVYIVSDSDDDNYFTTCQGCDRNFDYEDRLPLNLDCQHTMCLTCVKVGMNRLQLLCNFRSTYQIFFLFLCSLFFSCSTKVLLLTFPLIEHFTLLQQKSNRNKSIDCSMCPSKTIMTDRNAFDLKTNYYVLKLIASEKRQATLKENYLQLKIQSIRYSVYCLYLIVH
jgi:hypothetical protein